MIRNFSGVTLSSTANGFRVVPDLRCGTQATVRTWRTSQISAQPTRNGDDLTVEFAATSPALIKTIRDSAPQRDIEVKFVMKGFPLGIGMRKGKAKLQEWINVWIQTNTGNGRLAAIHKKFHD